MPEDIIKARIVFEGGSAGDVKATEGTKNAPSSGGGFMGVGKSVATIAAGVTAGLATLTVIKKLWEKLVATSPRLQATLTILGRAVDLFLRPIADTLALFIRPLAIFLLKAGMRVFQWWQSNFSAGVKGTEIPRKPLEGAVARGNAPGATAGQTFAGVGAVIGGGIIGAADIINEFIKSIFMGFKTFGVDAVGDYAESASGRLREFIDGFVSYISKSFNDIGQFITTKITQPFSDFISMIGNWVKTNLVDPFINLMTVVGSWIMDKLVNPIVYFITNIADKVKDFFSFRWIPKSIRSFMGFQTGGYVPETGMYQLHQGEMVVPSHMAQGANNYSPSITINNPVINSNMDVRKIADQIAYYVNQSLRRRTTYGVMN